MATTRGHFLVVRSRLENTHPLDAYEGGRGGSTVWRWIVTIRPPRSDCHAVLHPTVRWSVMRDPGKKACMLIGCRRPVMAVVHAKLFVFVFVLIFPVHRCCVQDAEGSCEGDFCK